MDMQSEEKVMDLYDFWLLIRSHFVKLIITSIVVGLAALAISFTLPDEFTSTSRLASPKNADALNWLVTGEDVVLAMDKQLHLRQYYGASTLARLKSRWSRHVEVRKSKEGFIDISVTDTDPKFATRLANAIAAFAQQELINRQLSEPSRQLQQETISLNEAKQEFAKANALLDRPVVTKILGALTDFERYMVEGVAKSQAEIAMSVGEGADLSKAANPTRELVQLLSQLTATTSGKDGANRLAAPNGEQMQALSLLQGSVYWRTLADGLQRKVSLMRSQALADAQFEPATVPDYKSGPSRANNAIIATLLAAFAYVIGLLIAAGWKSLSARHQDVVAP